MTEREIPRITDKNLPALVENERAVLILTKSDCAHCRSYAAEIEERRDAGVLADAHVGKMVLDAPGSGKFKLKNPWIAKLPTLPYTLLFAKGETVDHFAASKAAYLEERLAAASSREDPA